MKPILKSVKFFAEDGKYFCLCMYRKPLESQYQGEEEEPVISDIEAQGSEKWIVRNHAWAIAAGLRAPALGDAKKVVFWDMIDWQTSVPAEEVPLVESLAKMRR